MRTLVLFLTICCYALPPAFACEQGETLAFACDTTNGKRVEVCSAAETASYSFGRAGAEPELVLRKPKHELTYELSSGTGEASTYLTFRNGNASYTIESGQVYARDFPDGTHVAGGRFAGVSADVNGRMVASFACKPASIHDEQDALGIDWRLM